MRLHPFWDWTKHTFELTLKIIEGMVTDKDYSSTFKIADVYQVTNPP